MSNIDFESFTLDIWRDQVPFYSGAKTNESLCDFLDGFPMDEREFLLHTNNSASHLHDCWIFWQFASGALGQFTPNGTIFARYWRNIDRVLHIARILRATDLVSALEVSKQELETFPKALLDEYDQNLLLEQRDNGSVTPELAESLDRLLEMAYDDVVESGQVEGAKEAPPVGDSGHTLLDALASYLESIRRGAKIQVLTASPEEITSIVKELAPKWEQAKKSEYYASLGHKNFSSLITFYYGERTTFLDILTERGIRVAESPYRGPHDSSERYNASLICLIAEDGRRFAVVGFQDGEILLDLQTQKVIGRRELESERPEISGYEPLYLRDKPALRVEPSDFTLRFPRWYQPFMNTIKYD